MQLTKQIAGFILILCITLVCAKKEAMALSNPKTMLALGDSYTIGESVPAEERYPDQAVKKLNEMGIVFSAPEIIAETGWTTKNLIDKIKSTPPQKPTYDIVTLLIGVNNQYQKLSQKDYSHEFTILLDQAIQYAGKNKKHVIVISIPDYSVTPFAKDSDRQKIAKETDEFNAINQKISSTKGVHYLEITSSTRMAATDLSLVAQDGLHPSGKEYKIWADKLATLIQSIQ